MSWKYFQAETKLPSGRLYNILQSPVVTEKSHTGAQYSQVTFFVPVDANKHEIAAAVEKIYGAKVLAVNTLTMKGKNKRFRQRAGTRMDRKKAIVTLRPGQQIDLDSDLS